jgi:hypothetical protein
MRMYALLLLLFFGTAGSGQMVIDSYRFGAPAGLLLDDYPDAAAAYSLRLLRTAYTGDVITVRRSSDNDTLSIGFAGNYLDTAALKTFCGTGATDTCFVRDWFDQSGSGRNLQKTVDSAQPRILVDGVITRIDGIAVIDFTGTNDNLTNASYGFLSVDSNFTAILMVKANNTVESHIINLAINTNDRVTIMNSSFTLNKNSVLSHKSFTSTTNKTLYFAENSPQELYTNSILATGSTGINAVNSTTFSLGGRADNNISRNYNGSFYEVIFYNTNQSTNRAAIETNINNFYNIY